MTTLTLRLKHLLRYDDRRATELRIMAAERPDEWREVAALRGEGLSGTRSFPFAPIRARWVGVEIAKSDAGPPRIDEIEIYGAEQAPQDLREGRALSLYYYCLGCNVPLYLHIDLRGGNRECVVLWWYASTCGHLGIGGTHADAEVVRAQQAAMRWYHERERFYKRGEFYGANEEVHLHVLPEENAFVVNLFNPSDEERTITGSVKLRDVGLDANGTFQCSEAWGACAGGEVRVELKMPPWSARVAEFHGDAARVRGM